MNQSFFEVILIRGNWVNTFILMKSLAANAGNCLILQVLMLCKFFNYKISIVPPKITHL